MQGKNAILESQKEENGKSYEATRASSGHNTQVRRGQARAMHTISLLSRESGYVLGFLIPQKTLLYPDRGSLGQLDHALHPLPREASSQRYGRRRHLAGCFSPRHRSKGCREHARSGARGRTRNAHLTMLQAQCLSENLVEALLQATRRWVFG